MAQWPADFDAPRCTADDERLMDAARAAHGMVAIALAPPSAPHTSTASSRSLLPSMHMPTRRAAPRAKQRTYQAAD